MFRSQRKEPRLSQWDGRTRSTRHDEPVLPQLARRPVIARLAVVWLTIFVATGMVYLWGLPLPYRVGEVHPRDVRARVDFTVYNPTLTQLTQEETPRRQRDLVEPIFDTYKRGDPLVPRGQPTTPEQLRLLEEEHRAFVQSMRKRDIARRIAAVLLTLSLIATLVVLYVARFQPGLARSLPKVVGVCTLLLLTMGLGLLMNRPPWYGVFVPMTMTAMILTLGYQPPFALMMSFSLALAMSVALNADLNYLLVQTGGLATAILALRNVRTRTRLVEVAAAAGLAYLAMTFATGLLTSQTWNLMATDASRHFGWGLLAGFLLTGSMPLVERVFGIVTDVRLLELADGSHPLLQELVRRAPGTYTHSMTVATLAESAAEAIGGNPLLTRVGSYFHDIGKMLKPHYFIENQNGENRHDALEPALSTLVIIGHVKDGVALAKQYNLPRPIVDFVEQHHGTTLVEYFYREAMRLQEQNGHGTVELEAAFRYPGPKPQTRENGIVMLADAVESSSRALGDPTPSSLRKLVHDLLMKRLLDGQFEESGLTLTELHLVEEALSKSLIALFHSRIKYPEPREATGLAS